MPIASETTTQTIATVRVGLDQGELLGEHERSHAGQQSAQDPEDRHKRPEADSSRQCPGGAGGTHARHHDGDRHEQRGQRGMETPFPLLPLVLVGQRVPLVI